MLRNLLLLLLCGVVSCSITCPDGVRCHDQQTCCNTEQGYRCCPYPNAVCCADRAHCCPFGYVCDQTTEMCVKRWGNGPQTLGEEAPLWVKQAPLQEGQAPPSVDQAPPSVDQASPSVDQASRSMIHCDSYYTCPDGTTCCRHPAGGYTCCPYSSARCCLDGYHCCPYGYDCDRTYTHCIRQGVPHPFSQRRPSSRPADPVDVPDQASSSGVPAQPAALTRSPLGKEPAPPSVDQASPSVDQASRSMIHCDSYYTCPDGTTCCRHPAGGYSCCPYSPARCCLDGYHCCPYGYDCDRTYTHCIRQGVPHPFSQRRPCIRPADPVGVPDQASSSGVPAQPAALTRSPLGEEPAQDGGVIRCDSQFHCPKGSSCCQNQSKEWNCCPYPLGVCCSDGIHCCEYGYSCDPTSKVCRRSLPSL